MQQKSLHVQEPKCSQKQATSDQNKEFRRTCVTERCECSESERREISERAEHGHRNSAQPGIRTAQYAKTIRRTSTAQGLAGEGLHAQISCVGQTHHGNNRHCRVKNIAKSRYRHNRNDDWLRFVGPSNRAEIKSETRYNGLTI